MTVTIDPVLVDTIAITCRLSDDIIYIFDDGSNTDRELAIKLWLDREVNELVILETDVDVFSEEFEAHLGEQTVTVEDAEVVEQDSYAGSARYELEAFWGEPWGMEISIAFDCRDFSLDETAEPSGD